MGDNYETHARGSEDLRDAMDGHLSEPGTRSTENNAGSNDTNHERSDQ